MQLDQTTREESTIKMQLFRDRLGSRLRRAFRIRCLHGARNQRPHRDHGHLSICPVVQHLLVKVFDYPAAIRPGTLF
jgi:hypothetical protein